MSLRTRLLETATRGGLTCQRRENASLLLRCLPALSFSSGNHKSRAAFGVNKKLTGKSSQRKKQGGGHGKAGKRYSGAEGREPEPESRSRLVRRLRGCKRRRAGSGTVGGRRACAEAGTTAGSLKGGRPNICTLERCTLERRYVERRRRRWSPEHRRS